MSTNITSTHKKNFQFILDRGKVALFSAFMDGKPVSAIVGVGEDEMGMVTMTPLFVSVESWMKLTDHDGNQPSEGGTEI